MRAEMSRYRHELLFLWSWAETNRRGCLGGLVWQREQRANGRVIALVWRTLSKHRHQNGALL
jgi:hypothetical protein